MREPKLGKGTDLLRIVVAKKKWYLLSWAPLLPCPWGILPCHEWGSGQSLEFARCYLYRFMTLKGLKIGFLPQNPMMYNEHTGVRFAMKDSKEMLCSTYVYNLLLISSGFRDTEFSMGRLWHYIQRRDHLLLFYTLSLHLYQQFGMQSNFCWFKWISRVPLGL